MRNVCGVDIAPVLSSTIIGTDNVLAGAVALAVISPVSGLIVSHIGRVNPPAKRHVIVPVPPVIIGVKLWVDPAGQAGMLVDRMTGGVPGVRGTTPGGACQPNDCAILFSKYLFILSFVRFA